MAELTQIINIASPAVSDDFNEIYEQIRDFNTAMQERLVLDHVFDGTEDDDTDADCDGYHKKLTMRGDTYDEENLPDCPTGGIVFFSIGGELCCYDGNTAKQITDGGNIAYDDPVNETSGISTDLFGIAYGDGLYIAVGVSGVILTSDDGTTWTSQDSGVSTNLYEVTYGDGLYIAVGYSGVILTSDDGTTWTSQDSGTTTILKGIAYGNGLYIAVGQSGVILTSDDGTTWTSQDSGTTTTLNTVCFSNIIEDRLFIIIGMDGVILSFPKYITLE